MTAKPRGLGPIYGAQFGDESVAAAYGLRPPYPDETFDVLVGLLAPGSRAILDAGCGRGEMARPLAARAERVDAVDPSRAMLDAGRELPGGDSPRIRWIHGYAEDAPLDPPYGLVVTAASLHWMDWDVVLPRFRDALAPGGVLAIVNDGALPAPWDDALAGIIPRYSTNWEFEPYDLIAELERRHLLQVQGRHTTRPVPFAQPVEDYVESFHARNGFSRDRMPPGSADAFDAEVRRAVAPHCPAGLVRLQIVSTITWGRPAVTAPQRPTRREMAGLASNGQTPPSDEEVARYPCPCCGYLVFADAPGSYDVCPICFWEDDLSQLRFADLGGGANRVSLLEGQRAYAALGACEDRFLSHVRRPTAEDRREAGWRPLDPRRDNIEEAEAVTDAAQTYPDDPTRLYYWRDTYWRR